ncbi:MAG TPA: SRPBCC family protein [Solirubrobacterales bacterium]|nr:SRPBCC family protein [Solirubrobacterales bacterium]
MIEFTVETDIERPVSEVFAYVTDPAKLPSWQTNTVSAVPEEDGPLRLGSRLREVHRAPGGKELKSLVEVSEFEQDKRFGLRMIEGDLPIHARIGFEHIDAGTRMFFTVHGQPSGAMRLTQPFLRHALKRQFRQHCATLKQVLESRSG